MNWFRRMVSDVAEAFTGLTSGRTRRVIEHEKRAMPFTLSTWNRGQDILPLVDLKSYAIEGYQRNSLVYACIRKIATTAPAAPLQVERFVKGQREAVFDHPLLKIFTRPNPYVFQFNLAESIHTFLNLFGEVFLLRVGTPEHTEELWFARPDRMRPIPGVKKLLGFVYYADDGARTPFLPDEVLHLKYPNPWDTWEGLGRGLSPLSAAAREADVDNSGTEFLKDFFANAAVPFGLLKSKQVLQDPDIKRIRKRIKEQYSGPRQWHEIMILDQEAEYQRMGLNIDEMALPEIRNFTESRVCAVFDVPPILVGAQVGLRRSTFNNFSESRKALWHDKLIPDNQRVAEAMTAFFAPELEGLVIGHNYQNVGVLQEDRTAKFARADQGYSGGWMTLNEARREVGLQPRPEGDRLRSENVGV